MAKITNTIRVERALFKITQLELAVAVGVSKTSISNIERNKYNLRLILALKIANYFNKNINEIFKLK